MAVLRRKLPANPVAGRHAGPRIDAAVARERPGGRSELTLTGASGALQMVLPAAREGA